MESLIIPLRLKSRVMGEGRGKADEACVLAWGLEGGVENSERQIGRE